MFSKIDNLALLTIDSYFLTHHISKTTSSLNTILYQNICEPTTQLIFIYIYIYIFQFGEYLSTFQHPGSYYFEPQTAKKLFEKVSHKNNWFEEKEKK